MFYDKNNYIQRLNPVNYQEIFAAQQGRKRTEPFVGCKLFQNCKLCDNSECFLCEENYYKTYQTICEYCDFPSIVIDGLCMSPDDQVQFTQFINSENLSTFLIDNFTNPISSGRYIYIRFILDLQEHFISFQRAWVLKNFYDFLNLFIFDNSSQFSSLLMSYKIITPTYSTTSIHIQNAQDCDSSYKIDKGINSYQNDCVILCDVNLLTINNKCVQMLNGCSSIVSNQCLACSSGYTILSDINGNSFCVQSNQYNDNLVDNSSQDEYSNSLTCQIYNLTLNQCYLCTPSNEDNSSSSCSLQNCSNIYNNCGSCQFNAVTQDLTCNQCINGYTLDSDGYCIQIIPNCVIPLSIYNQQCFSCANGYSQTNYFDCLLSNPSCDQPNFLKDGKCVECNNGLISNCRYCCYDNNSIGKTCNQCDENSLLVQMNDFYGCIPYTDTVCDTNYSINMNCKSIDNCIQYDDYFTCEECEDNFYYNQLESKCQKIKDNCLIYDITGNCIECEDNYMINEQQQCIQACLQLDQECQVCKTDDIFVCSSCKGNYILKNGFCMQQCHQTVDFCYQCDEQDEIYCVECQKEFLLNNGNCLFYYQNLVELYEDNQCLLQINNCISCNKLNSKICSECSDEYILIYNECVKNILCSQYCLACQDDFCVYCDYGYILIDGRCVSNDSIYQNQDNQLYCQGINILCFNKILINQECQVCKQQCECKMREQNNVFFLQCSNSIFIIFSDTNLRVKIFNGQEDNELIFQFNNSQVNFYEINLNQNYFQQTANCSPNTQTFLIQNHYYNPESIAYQVASVTMGSSLSTIFSLSFSFIPQWAIFILFSLLQEKQIIDFMTQQYRMNYGQFFNFYAKIQINTSIMNYTTPQKNYEFHFNLGQKGNIDFELFYIDEIIFVSLQFISVITKICINLIKLFNSKRKKILISSTYYQEILKVLTFISPLIYLNTILYYLIMIFPRQMQVMTMIPIMNLEYKILFFVKFQVINLFGLKFIYDMYLFSFQYRRKNDIFETFPHKLFQYYNKIISQFQFLQIILFLFQEFTIIIWSYSQQFANVLLMIQSSVYCVLILLKSKQGDVFLQKLGFILFICELFFVFFIGIGSMKNWKQFSSFRTEDVFFLLTILMKIIEGVLMYRLIKKFETHSPIFVITKKGEKISFADFKQKNKIQSENQIKPKIQKSQRKVQSKNSTLQNLQPLHRNAVQELKKRLSGVKSFIQE